MQSGRFSHTIRASCIAIALTPWTAPPVAAQDGGAAPQADRQQPPQQDQTENDEQAGRFTEEVTVTVTSRKREENMQSVPFSVVAPTEQVLWNRGARNIEDVSANVAGFSVQNLGPGQSQIAMRGVSAGQIVRDQPGVKEQVGVYLDESVISGVALHAGYRSVRHVAHRGAARSAGHAVRLWIPVRHGALHHEPAG